MVDDMERRGLDLAAREQYAAARALFEQVLPQRTTSQQRAQVLQNIMLTYEHEGNTAHAIEICRDILAIPGLGDTVEGILLRGQIRAHITRLQGGSIWKASGISTVFAALSAGAALGAALGTKVHGSGYTIFGQPVDQGLRYGGALLGAWLGVFLFLRPAAAAGPTMSLIAGLACTALTTYVLLQDNITVGLATLGMIVLPPIFLAACLWARR
jgi:hypothetical protein